MPLTIEKFSLGVGDRFARQATAQLQAVMRAAEKGVEVVPVWNKSHREHTTIGSRPISVRQAADAAVSQLGWTASYYVDADHINLQTVDAFLESSDFFTIDVADAIGQPANESDCLALVDKCPELVGELHIEGVGQPLDLTRESMSAIASKYLRAVQQAGEIYRYLQNRKGAGQFVTEVSLDETDRPQTPPELLVILAALAHEGIPLQTIAPKFSGRFNKGVDYVGIPRQFEQQFRNDLGVIRYAIRQYGLPSNLKLSVHSGSDKFSLYGPIRRALQETGAGLHLKTAGTTWLEELIGLAESDGEGLALAKEVYVEALQHQDQLCQPYQSVIDIDPTRLPSPDEVQVWSADDYVAALRHDPDDERFNPALRQLLHVGYKIAAGMGGRYLAMLDDCQESISRNVTENLYQRHLHPLFLD